LVIRRYQRKLMQPPTTTSQTHLTPSLHGVRRLRNAVTLIIFAATLLLYIATAGPSIVELFDDSLEFQLVGPTLGIAHPTGYPLYVAAGALWSRVFFPLGNWAWRMNLFSALFGALTVALLFHLTTRLVTHADERPNLWAGLAAALTFGLAPTWWGQSTIAEVYALHNFLLIAILNVAIGINQTVVNQSVDKAPAGRDFTRRMALLALLIGLGLAHHRTIVLVLPGLALYLLWSVPNVWRPRRAWLLWLAALVGPLLLYGLLPLRAAMGVRDLNQSYVNTLNGFLDHVLARRYAAFFGDNALAVERTLLDWLRLAVHEVGLAALLLALLGLPWLVDRQRRPAKAWILVLVVLVTNLFFAINYRVGDVEVFLLPVFLCLAIFTGGGVGIFARLLDWRNAIAAGAVQAGLVFLLLLGISGRGPGVNRSQDWTAHDYAVSLAKVPFPAQSHVIGLEGETTALKYMQQAEGLGRAATAVAADDPTARAAAVATLVDQGVPVYLTRELPGVEEIYSFSGDGPLVRVWPRGSARPDPPEHALDLAFADEALRLIGYDATLLEQAGGPALELVLAWQPLKKLARNFKLSLRVLDESGTPLLYADGAPAVADRFPLRQVAPSWSWLPEEVVRDVHVLPLPDTWAQDADRIQLIMYDAETIAEVGRWELATKPLRPSE
jgi:hypothetical protein